MFEIVEFGGLRGLHLLVDVGYGGFELGGDGDGLLCGAVFSLDGSVEATDAQEGIVIPEEGFGFDAEGFANGAEEEQLIIGVFLKITKSR